MARVHASASDLPHAGIAPGTHAHGTLQLPRSSWSGKGEDQRPRRFPRSRERSQTGERPLHIVDDFDASRECREVTCLYNGVNWWLEKMISDPLTDLASEPAEERLDYFL